MLEFGFGFRCGHNKRNSFVVRRPPGVSVCVCVRCVLWPAPTPSRAAESPLKVQLHQHSCLEVARGHNDNSIYVANVDQIRFGLNLVTASHDIAKMHAVARTAANWPAREPVTVRRTPAFARQCLPKF